MPDLAGRGPLGQKARKQPSKARKPIPRISAKKRAHKAAEASHGASEHMVAVKGLACVACHAPPPSEAHHVTGDKKPRSDWRVIPLCADCHRGQNGYHNAKKTWVARHGPDFLFLDLVAHLLA